MAGMLPGVELARRRKAHHHGYYDSTSPSSPRSFNSAPSSMDETALRARRRLQQKLGNITSRLDNYHQKNRESISEGDHETNTVQKKEKLFNLPMLRRSNSQKEVCSICLEEFKGRQSVMNLPCCHRYHADCLLPWLASNSRCPYCRTHVQT